MRKGFSKTLLIVATMAATLGVGLFGSVPARAQETRVADMQADYAAVGGTTRTPYGWADLCGRQPQECQVEVLEPVDLHLTGKTLQMIERVNARVNDEIVPVSNYDHWGTMLDHWDYPTDGKGDCKIYALWKRKILIDMGLPRQALLMTIVRDREGNGHTILTVKTDRGEFVLDNMAAGIRGWSQTGYTFVKRQSQADPNVWVTVGPNGGHRVAGLGSPDRRIN